MARRRSNRRLSRKQPAQGLWFWAAGILMLMGLVVFSQIQPPRVNPETFCPEKELGTTVLLIDVSDSLSNSQKARIKNELENISAQSKSREVPYLRKGERLAAYFLEEDGNVPIKVFDFCNPGDPKNRSFLEQLYEGQIFADKKWRTFSEDIFDKIEQKLELSEGSDTSPIIESLKFIRETEFPPPDLIDERKSYRIILWSDMLQNSRLENHFQSRAEEIDIFEQNPIYMDHIETVVFYMASEKYHPFQGNEHAYWWRRFFALAVAELDWKNL